MKLFHRLGVLSLVVLVGCSGGGDRWTKNLPETVNASGVVLLDGEPVEGAQVVFAPATGEHAASGLTDSEGIFYAKAFPSKEGAVPGTYQVGVSKTVEVKSEVTPKELEATGEDAAHALESGTTTVGWENALPQHYASPVKSNLEVVIPAEGTSDLSIELSSS